MSRNKYTRVPESHFGQTRRTSSWSPLPRKTEQHFLVCYGFINNERLKATSTPMWRSNQGVPDKGGNHHQNPPPNLSNFNFQPSIQKFSRKKIQSLLNQTKLLGKRNSISPSSTQVIIITPHKSFLQCSITQ